MPTNKIDHLVVTAPTLESGACFAQRCLGIELTPGGKHPRMGTHNMLARLGDGLFLEIIAVDPDAPAPDRVRWFGLDALAGRATPRLATWVVRTDDIVDASARSAYATGPIDRQTRDRRDWRITIPEDGSLPLHGVAPMLIQWQDTDHPADTLPHLGLELESLELHHPDPSVVDDMLGRLRIESGVELLTRRTTGLPFLVANIRTPTGMRKVA